MRRFLLILSVIFTLLLTSCSVIPTDKPPYLNFEANIEFTENEKTFKCKIINTSKEVTSILINEPTELKGIKFEWLGDEYKIEYGKLKCISTVEYLPINSFASALVDVLNCSHIEELTIKESKEDETIYQGKSQNGVFNITTDKENGAIKNIEIKNLNYNFKFSDITLL